MTNATVTTHIGERPMDNQPIKSDAALKLLMKACWNKYQLSGDVIYLIEAVRAAPFFGERELASEIARLLNSLRPGV